MKSSKITQLLTEFKTPDVVLVVSMVMSIHPTVKGSPDSLQPLLAPGALHRPAALRR